MKYVKDSPRLTVKYINGDTDETIFEVNDRNWMNVGELLSDHYVTEVLTANKIKKPQNLMVLVVGEYTLHN